MQLVLSCYYKREKGLLHNPLKFLTQCRFISPPLCGFYLSDHFVEH
jgi:hypothetical protein